MDTVVPMEQGAVYACIVVCSMEVAMVSTEVSMMKVSVDTSYSLLGHRSIDWVCKTAWELGWVMSHGAMHACEHCAKSKTKQKNVRKASVMEIATTPGHRLYLDLLKVTVKSSTSESETINQDSWKVVVFEATERNGLISR